MWKHNNSLYEKSTYVNSVKKKQQNVWEYLKYKIRKFSKKLSKEAARSKNIVYSASEARLKISGSKIRYRDDPEYVHCKEELAKLYEGKINGAIIRSSCDITVLIFPSN